MEIRLVRAGKEFKTELTKCVEKLKTALEYREPNFTYHISLK